MAVIYLAHPLASDPINNPARVRRWLRFLMDREPDHSFVLPWLPYLEIGYPYEDRAFGARALRDDCAIAARCEGIALTGPRVSGGMTKEIHACASGGGWVSDLTMEIDPILFGLDQAFAAFTPGESLIAYGRRRWEASLL
jgi:hypothetical protein